MIISKKHGIYELPHELTSNYNQKTVQKLKLNFFRSALFHTNTKFVSYILVRTVGLKALRNALENRNYEKIPTESLIKMAEFVLKTITLNLIVIFFQQISGTPLGTSFAPPYACNFVDQQETKLLETQILKTLVWFRCIENIFFIWTHGEEKLKKFMEDFNSFSDDIKFTYKSDKESISFLNLRVISSNGKRMTSLYSKPIDYHHYVHYTSIHPEHTEGFIIYSETLRVKRVCSQESDFKEHSSIFKL